MVIEHFGTIILVKYQIMHFCNWNQLRELDISNNAIVNFPVHVFHGLICLKEMN